MAGRRRVLVAWSLFGAAAAVSAYLVLQRPPHQRLSDLHIYYGAARTVRAGRPLYEYVAENGGPFTYPPFAVLLLRPAASLPEPALRVLWLALTCAAIVAIAVTVCRGIDPGRPDRRLVVAAVAGAVLLSAPAQSNLRFGQVSVFIVLLALLDGAGAVPARFRGVLVGVAAAIKLTPLLFVVYFLVARRYADAARAVAAFVACALIGAAVLPRDSVVYWTGTVVATSRIGNLASLGNQSVHGMLLRVGVEPATLPLVWAALVSVVCGVALLRARRLHLDGEPVRAAVLVGCATVAASPVSWTHHQLWPVLAAMLMMATHGAVQRAAGVALLVVMTVSLGVVLRPVSTYPGLQFLFENARTVGVVATCLAGLGTVAVLATTGRVWLRAGVSVAAALAFVAVLPLPAGADPTFKAYTRADVDNPRYFFFCRDAAGCAARAAGAAVSFGVAREKTKVRVNGVVDGTVARLSYRSAPGGPARDIPLVEIYPGQRAFSFRSATMAYGTLLVFGADGQVLAAYSSELSAGLPGRARR